MEEQKICGCERRSLRCGLFDCVLRCREVGPADVIGRQLVRCGTSVGAQYREACRARSVAEFISKLESAAQELDETIYWLELLAESRIVALEKLTLLQKEAHELMAIFVASVRTAKGNKRKVIGRE